MKKIIFIIIILVVYSTSNSEEVPAGYAAKWKTKLLSEIDYKINEDLNCESFAGILRKGKIEQPQVIALKMIEETLNNFIKGYSNKENIIFDKVVVWPNYEQSNWYVLMGHKDCFVRWIEIQPDNIQSIINDGNNL